MPPIKRRYTKPEKARAVGIALAVGTQAAEKATGIAARTINYWKALPEWDEMRRQTPDIVAEQMWAAVQMGVEEVAKGLRGDASLRDKATALGILYDKHALLTGGATARSENRDITARRLTDHETDALTRAIEGYLGGSGRPSDGPSGAPEGEGLSEVSG